MKRLKEKIKQGGRVDGGNHGKWCHGVGAAGRQSTSYSLITVIFETLASIKDRKYCSKEPFAYVVKNKTVT